MLGVFIAKWKVRSAFAALNRKDIKKFISTWSDDCEFAYPGQVSASGKMVGKAAIEEWFVKFLDQFPSVKFTVNHICLDNALDMLGINTVAVQWNVELINKHGHNVSNHGITLIKIKYGKATTVVDYLFDTGEKFKKAWSEQ